MEGGEREHTFTFFFCRATRTHLATTSSSTLNLIYCLDFTMSSPPWTRQKPTEKEKNKLIEQYINGAYVSECVRSVDKGCSHSEPR